MYALMACLFIVGYLLIVFEDFIHINKSATAILTAVLTWAVLSLGADTISGIQAESSNTPVQQIIYALRHHLGEISEILFFLMGAMTIVELVDAHEGFKVITDRITASKKVTFLWVVGVITFFLSAILDNLTTTIVMVSLLRKLIADQRDRWFFASIIVIAANAGGAWSPIGDVTTTMLWIGGQITSFGIVRQMLLPSLVCILIPMLVLSVILKGNVLRPAIQLHDEDYSNPVTPFERNLVFLMGIGALIFVPVFKTVTHLPPYMGILFGLGALWITTELIHRGKNEEDKHSLSVVGVLRKIDIPTILFFLGILLAVASLATAGHLAQVAVALRESLGNIYAINLAIGLLSSIIDNVPLVAGAMNMYPLLSANQVMEHGEQASWLVNFVVDGNFWGFLAYCAGTGGSCLIIGSAAGIAAMSMERITFFWYLKNISMLALLGYLSGALVFIAMSFF